MKTKLIWSPQNSSIAMDGGQIDFSMTFGIL
jgi:hypothetical protein